MALWQLWWVWLAGGVVLGIAEIFLPGFVFLGFAIGAAVTGMLMGLGLLGGNLAWMLLVFALASLAAWGVLRRAVGVRKGQIKLWDRDINEN